MATHNELQHLREQYAELQGNHGKLRQELDTTVAEQTAKQTALKTALEDARSQRTAREHPQQDAPVSVDELDDVMRILGNMRTRVINNDRKSQDAEANTTKKEEEIEKLKSSLATKSAECEQLKANERKAWKQAEDKAIIVRERDAKISTLEEKKLEQWTEIQHLKDDNKACEEAKKQLEAALEEWKAKCPEKATATEDASTVQKDEEIERLKTDNKRLLADNEACGKSKKQLETTLEECKANGAEQAAKAHDGSTAEKDEEIKRLQADNEACGKRKKELEAAVEQWKTKCAFREGEIKDELARLFKENRSLRRQNEFAADDNGERRTEREEARRRTEEDEELIRQLTADRDRYFDEKTQLEAEMEWQTTLRHTNLGLQKRSTKPETLEEALSVIGQQKKAIEKLIAGDRNLGTIYALEKRIGELELDLAYTEKRADENLDLAKNMLSDEPDLIFLQGALAKVTRELECYKKECELLRAGMDRAFDEDSKFWFTMCPQCRRRYPELREDGTKKGFARNPILRRPDTEFEDVSGVADSDPDAITKLKQQHSRAVQQIGLLVRQQHRMRKIALANADLMRTLHEVRSKYRILVAKKEGLEHDYSKEYGPCQCGACTLEGEVKKLVEERVAKRFAREQAENEKWDIYGGLQTEEEFIARARELAGVEPNPPAGLDTSIAARRNNNPPARLNTNSPALSALKAGAQPFTPRGGLTQPHPNSASPNTEQRSSRNMNPPAQGNITSYTDESGTTHWAYLDENLKKKRLAEPKEKFIIQISDSETSNSSSEEESESEHDGKATNIGAKELGNAPASSKEKEKTEVQGSDEQQTTPLASTTETGESIAAATGKDSVPQSTKPLTNDPAVLPPSDSSQVPVVPPSQPDQDVSEAAVQGGNVQQDAKRISSSDKQPSDTTTLAPPTSTDTSSNEKIDTKKPTNAPVTQPQASNPPPYAPVTDLVPSPRRSQPFGRTAPNTQRPHTPNTPQNQIRRPSQPAHPNARNTQTPLTQIRPVTEQRGPPHSPHAPVTDLVPSQRPSQPSTSTALVVKEPEAKKPEDKGPDAKKPVEGELVQSTTQGSPATETSAPRPPLRVPVIIEYQRQGSSQPSTPSPWGAWNSDTKVNWGDISPDSPSATTPAVPNALVPSTPTISSIAGPSGGPLRLTGSVTQEPDNTPVPPPRPTIASSAGNSGGLGASRYDTGPVTRAPPSAPLNLTPAAGTAPPSTGQTGTSATNTGDGQPNTPTTPRERGRGNHRGGRGGGGRGRGGRGDGRRGSRSRGGNNRGGNNRGGRGGGGGQQA